MPDDTENTATSPLIQSPGSEFLGYNEPMGTQITLRPDDTARVRLAKHFFHGEMFRYFENLANGQAGWGISFNGWLEIHGWKLVGYRTYERIQGMEDDSPNVEARHPA